MKPAHIAKVLGWAETPDHTEGLFLQNEEVAAIDKTLGEADATATALSTANAELSGLKTKNAEQASQIEKDAATITALQAQVAELGKAPSGKGSVVVTPAAAEAKEDNAEGVKFDSAEHPANKFADSQKGYKSDLPGLK